MAQVRSPQVPVGKDGVRLYGRVGKPALQREKKSPHRLLRLPAWGQEEKKKLKELGASTRASSTDRRAPGRGKFPGAPHGSGPLRGCLVGSKQQDGGSLRIIT